MTLTLILAVGLLPAAMQRVPVAAAPEVSAPGPATFAEESRPSLEGVELVVGSKGFTEQYILAELLSLQLEAAGATVRQRPNMGSTILFDALRTGTVDVSVDYSGTIWATIMHRPEPIDRTAMLIEVAAFLKEDHGVITLGRLGFENAYALAMSRGRARELGIRDIGDLEKHARGLTIGGDPEFFGRLEWTRVRETYGLDAIRSRGMDSTFMYGAVRDGGVDVITAYSTDGRIAAFDLVVLEDPEHAFPPYDAVILLSPMAARNPQIAEALLPLVNAVSDETMRWANKMVDTHGLTTGEAARQLHRRVAGR
jgi:osmoprotectant transport system permease protein